MVALPKRTQPPRVVMLRTAFLRLCEETGVTAEQTSDPDWPGSPMPGFRGTASTMATFILAARETLGIYDAQILASTVRSQPASTAPREIRPTREMLRFYYFPGLELL